MIRNATTILLLIIGTVFALQKSISQDSVTFYFNEAKTVGKFANGDYWVLGPVTIDSITPHAYIDSTCKPIRYMHGWEIDPIVLDSNGFDSKAPSFSWNKVQKLPITINGTKSLVKVVSRQCEGSCYPALQRAIVLTIVDKIPPNHGRSVFRPTYISATKIMRDTNTIDWAFLPNTVPSDLHKTPEIKELLEQNRKVKFDHIAGNQMITRPLENLNSYLPAVTTDAANAIAYLCSNIPLEEKKLLTVYMVQFGLDWYSFLENGYTWPRGGGEMAGSILPIAFATALLNDDTMKQTIQNIADTSDHWPYENHTLYYNKDGVALWGNLGFKDPSIQEDRYWHQNASATLRDPYGLIDGGHVPGDYYQYCCTSQPWKCMRMVFKLLGPKMDSIWYNQAFVDYVDRWVNFGVHTQSDTCAPFSEDGLYGIDYGPDGKGGCVADDDPSDGIGRFPDLHHTKADGGNYRSRYIDEIWTYFHEKKNSIQKTKHGINNQNSRPLMQIPKFGLLNYTLPSPEHVQLRIFNIKGQLMAELVNQTQNKGSYQLRLDDNYSSGLFVITFKAGQYYQKSVMHHFK